MRNIFSFKTLCFQNNRKAHTPNALKKGRDINGKMIFAISFLFTDVRFSISRFSFFPNFSVISWTQLNGSFCVFFPSWRRHTHTRTLHAANRCLFSEACLCHYIFLTTLRFSTQISLKSTNGGGYRKYKQTLRKFLYYSPIIRKTWSGFGH